MIKGSIVAIVTPMQADGSLDYPSLKSLIDFHVKEGTDGIVVVGTTGESPTVDVDEHCELIRATVEYAAGRIPVVAGTGGNSTSEAIELTDYAKRVGATASLNVVPYYNKPTQEGLYRHFKAIAEAVDLPMILYNVPGRTVADLGNDTTLRLAQVPALWESRMQPGILSGVLISSSGCLMGSPFIAAMMPVPCLHSARWSWDNFGHRQCGAKTDARNVRGCACGQCRACS